MLTVILGALLFAALVCISLLQFRIRLLKNVLKKQEDDRERAINETESESSRQAQELLEVQMKFAQLQNQINPHFLYNTLENIRARAIIDDQPVIADMTEALSRYFRYNISKREDVVTLKEELENIRCYIQIQQYRFSGKFEYRMGAHDGDDDLIQSRIPKMTLQPIVENAIYHGMENKIGKGLIEIHMESDANHVYVVVSDDGVGMSEMQLEELRKKLDQKEVSSSSGGIAMVNINRRLKLLYGEQCGLKVSSIQGVGTEVTVILPRIDDKREMPDGRESEVLQL